jgi:hypothetical protein
MRTAHGRGQDVIMAEESDFGSKLAALKAAAGRQRGLTPGGGLIQALNDIARHPDIDHEAIVRLIVETGSPTGAGFLATWYGAGVESGRDPGLTCRPITDAFLKWSRTIATPADGAASENAGNVPPPGEETIDQETIDGLQWLGQALVAHLTRSAELRCWFMEADGICSELERLEPYSIGAVWVLQLLRQRSGTIVVLNVMQRTGAVIRYGNIANCFHLFTLLQGALAGVMPDAQEVNGELLDMARGKGPVVKGHDHAWWHYGQACSVTPDLGSSVWGEAAPDSIASVDGQQVMLLWPPILQSRGWDTGFFAPILEASPPGVEVIEVLSAADADAWRQRLGLS